MADETKPLNEIVKKLVRAYPVPAWTAERMLLWVEMLEDLDLLMLASVVRDWILTKREVPTIADIRKAVADKQLGNAAGGRLFLDHDEAWKFVSQCFGTVGRNQDFPDTHPLVKAAVDATGWVEMCNSENVDVLRGQFRKAYESVLARSLSESAASEGAAAAPSAVADLVGQQVPQLEHEHPRLGASRG